ncbi:hypothetical protein, partial [Micromonospora sp. CP22]|uniref:hypothetical protein n=1 Tax=Micromonospora sp. CP22 TaxID=2580517 RepID=UPI001E33F212
PVVNRHTDKPAAPSTGPDQPHLKHALRLESTSQIEINLWVCAARLMLYLNVTIYTTHDERKHPQIERPLPDR